MSRAQLSHVAHGDHPIASPLSDHSVSTLLKRAKLPANAKVLDIGCGEGEWVVRALQTHPSATAVAIDLAEPAVLATRDRATSVGVADRLSVQQCAAAEFSTQTRFDALLCVGATQAFGGMIPTLREAVKWVSEGGVLVVGGGFWATEPTQTALQSLGATRDEFGTLSALVATIEAEGWAVVYAHVSTDAEWDDYEWSWTGTLARWSLTHRNDPLAEQALALSKAHRDAWLNGYRGVLGFVTFVLIRTANSLTKE